METLEKKAISDNKNLTQTNTTQTDTLTYIFQTNSPYISQTTQDLDKDYQSGARLLKVSPNQLPSGALGMYDPSTHTIYIANDLSSYEDLFVRSHESAHALGARDEFKTDAHASSNTGYNLRPFGKSDILRR